MDLTAARINHAMLANFINQRVIIIGKVLSTAPDMVQLETSVSSALLHATVGFLHA